LRKRQQATILGAQSLPQINYASLFGVVVIVAVVMMMEDVDGLLVMVVVVVVMMLVMKHTAEGGFSHHSLPYLGHHHQ
jgi:uncharacterized membrane protein YhhN